MSRRHVLLLIGGAYLTSSYILYHFPYLLHRPHVSHFKAVHISHRGGAGEALENTMEAFRRAAALGTDMLEIDCHLTLDGHVIVSHDNKLDRVSGLASTISDLTLDQLPHILETLDVEFAPGRKCSASDTQCLDRKFATLRDLFIEFPTMPVNIDIKQNDDELIKKVSNLVKEFHRENLTVWGNGSSKITNKCYQVNSNIGLIFSRRRVFTILALFYTGLLPFVPIKEQYFEIPMPSTVHHVFRQNTGPCLWFETIVYLLDKLLMRPALFRHLKKRGIKTFVWVLNTDEEFQRAFEELGADGVMTDYPTRLRDYLLENNPSWHPRKNLT